MLLISEGTLSTAQSAIVSATHSLHKIDGRPYTLGTIDAKVLRSATLAALAIICGTPVDTQLPDHLPAPGT